MACHELFINFSVKRPDHYSTFKAKMADIKLIVVILSGNTVFRKMSIHNIIIIIKYQIELIWPMRLQERTFTFRCLRSSTAAVGLV